MTPELEKLIDLALADGVLTPKEKQIITRKAKELGIDLDELEMVLEGKLYIAQNAMQQNTPPAPAQQTQSNKEGSLRKCPSCGSAAQSFASNCGDCGHEFRGINANHTITELNNKLNNIKGNYDSYNNSDIEEQRQNIISTFPIPTSKEDMLEFLSVALSKITGHYGEGESKVWIQKCEEIIIRMDIAFSSDKQLMEKVTEFKNTLRKGKKKNAIDSFFIVGGSILFIAIMYYFIFAFKK